MASTPCRCRARWGAKRYLPTWLSAYMSGSSGIFVGREKHHHTGFSRIDCPKSRRYLGNCSRNDLASAVQIWLNNTPFFGLQGPLFGWTSFFIREGWKRDTKNKTRTAAERNFDQNCKRSRIYFASPRWRSGGQEKHFSKPQITVSLTKLSNRFSVVVPPPAPHTWLSPQPHPLVNLLLDVRSATQASSIIKIRCTISAAVLFDKVIREKPWPDGHFRIRDHGGMLSPSSAPPPPPTYLRFWRSLSPSVFYSIYCLERISRADRNRWRSHKVVPVLQTLLDNITDQTNKFVNRSTVFSSQIRSRSNKTAH